MHREGLLLVLVASLAFSMACAPSRPLRLEGEQSAASPEDALHRTEAAGGFAWEASEPPPVRISTLSGGSLRLTFPSPEIHPGMERLRVDEVRPFVAAFDSLRPRGRLPLRLLEVPGATHSKRKPADGWESKLREDFFALHGPPLLPVPESLETSRLLLALQHSTRYMGEGMREAAHELFNAPAFILSVSLSIAVYFAAWLAPEPIFSKGLAAVLTARLALLVGLVELGRVAHACIRLYQEAEAATSPHELEAASERFGRALGGTGLRVLVVVASLGVPQVLPKVPQGGLWTLLSPLRHAPAGGPALESLATAQVVADGSLVVTGVAAETSAASLCGELATCMKMDGPGGGSGNGPKLSTRYGKPHTRQNPPHNEAIEEELARREAAGHTGLKKNEAQVNAQNMRVNDPNPSARPRFRKPDVSSRRPDGIRHNTNYVSNPKDLKRELDAFNSMVQADKKAIHELYLLNGTLVRRYVPPGVSFP